MHRARGAEVLERADVNRAVSARAGADQPVNTHADRRSGRQAPARRTRGTGSRGFLDHRPQRWLSSVIPALAQSRQDAPVLTVMVNLCRDHENGQRSELLGYREDLWKKKSGMTGGWSSVFLADHDWRHHGFMVGRSLHLTRVRALPRDGYAINTHEDISLIYSNAPPTSAGVPRTSRFSSSRDGKTGHLPAAA